MPREVLPARWRPRRAWVLVALVVACVASQRLYRAIERASTSKVDLDALETSRLERRAVAWMSQHPDRGCPSATELAAGHDVFGTPFLVSCGYVLRISARSSGFDGVFDTADDIGAR
jgi:hypothetical protein